MTKNEVLDFLDSCEHCKEEKPFGYMVVAISKEDIAVNASKVFIDKFEQMNEVDKENELSDIADSLNDVFENEMFHDVMKMILLERED